MNTLKWVNGEAIILFTLNGRLNTVEYQKRLQQLEAMCKERDNIALIIHYAPDYGIEHSQFVDNAKHFYQLMNDMGLWHIVVTTKNTAIINLWNGTLTMYKIEPPTYDFAKTVDEAIEQITAKRQG